MGSYCISVVLEFCFGECLITPFEQLTLRTLTTSVSSPTSPLPTPLDLVLQQKQAVSRHLHACQITSVVSESSRPHRL